MLTLVLNVIHFLAEVQRQQGEPGLHLHVVHPTFALPRRPPPETFQSRTRPLGSHIVVSLCLVSQLWNGACQGIHSQLRPIDMIALNKCTEVLSNRLSWLRQLQQFTQPGLFYKQEKCICSSSGMWHLLIWIVEGLSHGWHLSAKSSHDWKDLR